MPSLKALNRVLRKLESHNIPHFAWTDPDLPYGLTSIVTIPLKGDERVPFTNYRVYAPVAQLARASASKAEYDGSTPSGCAILTGESAEASARP